MTTAKLAMLVYGLAMIAMGVHGTVVAHEWMSLAGGGGMGLVVLLALFMSLKMASPRAGYILAALVALAGIGMFLPKYLRVDGKPYPHLVIVVLSALLVLFLFGGHLGAVLAKKRTA